MSHNVEIRGAKIPNDRVLIKAANELIREGLKGSLVTSNATMRGWHGREERCDIALRLSEYPYDVGFNRNQDGTYTPKCESLVRNYAGLSPDTGAKTLTGAMCPTGGPEVFIGRLLQRVNVITAEEAAARDGLITQRQTAPGGVVNVVAMRA